MVSARSTTPAPMEEQATKKRKSPAAAATAARCSLCGLDTTTLELLLVHVREDHKPAAGPQMALPLQVAQMLAQYALEHATLGDATTAWLGELQQQFRTAAALATALQQQDAQAAAVALRELPPAAPLWPTLQHAVRLTQPSPHEPNAGLQKPIAATHEPNAGLQKPKASSQEPTAAAIKTETTAAADRPHVGSPSHEEEAAQALTGLRGTGATPTAAATARPQPSFPSFPLSITAPSPPPPPQQQQQPAAGRSSPLFPTADLFPSTPATPATPATPSSLPSLFSRRLLAPLASPTTGRAAAVAAAAAAATTAATTAAATSLGWPDTQASPASLTPVYYRSFPSGPRGPATTATATTPTSPSKRRRLTSKQLSVRCDAQVAAARAAAASAALGPAARPGTPPPATRKANPRRWTKDEDEALRAAVESHREKNWKAIAAHVAGRNHTQCLQRWTKVLAPGLVKGHWSPAEDALLRRLVATEQKNWGDVAAKIPGRTSKQCRERWHNHLDPAIVRGAYTPEEDRLILEAQARLGNRWSVIAAMLPGRTEDAVKIRWKSHCRVWRARKYLRKPADAQTEAEAARTPRTPLLPPGRELAWPAVTAAADAAAKEAADEAEAASVAQATANM